MKKGLRRISPQHDGQDFALNPCPDEEGIKTLQKQHSENNLLALNPCPDEEGIKT